MGLLNIYECEKFSNKQIVKNNEMCISFFKYALPLIRVLRIKQRQEVVGDVPEFVCCAYISKFLYSHLTATFWYT
jgi:hypothetical protein